MSEQARMPRARRLAFPLAAAMICVAVSTVRAGDAAARIAAFDATLARYYRGESIEQAEVRVNRLVDAHNALVKRSNEASAARHARALALHAALDALRAPIDALERRLAVKPGRDDAAAVERYNALVAQQRAAVAEYNRAADETTRGIDGLNAESTAQAAAVHASATAVEREKGALVARRAAWSEFHEQGRDLELFTAINGTLAELRQAQRAGRDTAAVRDGIGALRRMRDELARWARAEERRSPNGLLLVDAEVDGEPVCFMVDSGASVTTLDASLSAAIGAPAGKESSFTLANGLKMKGRDLTIRRLAVAGVMARDVEAAAVPASSVGVDGLLGQSFLSKFVVTLDAQQAEPLHLAPRH